MSLEKISPAEMETWAAQEAFPPYAFYPDFDRERCRLYRARQLKAMGGRSDHEAWHWRGADGGEAAIGLTRLGWDTGQFGMPAGRVDYLIVKSPSWRAETRRPDVPEDRRVLAAATGAARELVTRSDAEGLQHLSARVDSREMPVIQAFEAVGFQFVDAILRFSLDLSRWPGAPSLPSGVTLRDATEADIEPLADLSARGFIYDRFHNDPSLPPGVADRVHAAWLVNAIQGRTGSGVLMAEVDGRSAGFFILALDAEAGDVIGTTIGTLVLISVDRTLRRRGVALALSLGAVDWLRDRGATRFEVGTQLANVPAASVYLKAGFRLVQTSVSLRRLAS